MRARRLIVCIFGNPSIWEKVPRFRGGSGLAVFLGQTFRSAPRLPAIGRWSDRGIVCGGNKRRTEPDPDAQIATPLPGTRDAGGICTNALLDAGRVGRAAPADPHGLALADPLGITGLFMFWAGCSTGGGENRQTGVEQ